MVGTLIFPGGGNRSALLLRHMTWQNLQRLKRMMQLLADLSLAAAVNAWCSADTHSMHACVFSMAYVHGLEKPAWACICTFSVPGEHEARISYDYCWHQHPSSCKHSLSANPLPAAALPVRAPLKASLTGLELLLARAQLWEETAAKHVRCMLQICHLPISDVTVSQARQVCITCGLHPPSEACSCAGRRHPVRLLQFPALSLQLSIERMDRSACGSSATLKRVDADIAHEGLAEIEPTKGDGGVIMFRNACSLTEVLRPVAGLARRWRQLELAFWHGLLDATVARYAQGGPNASYRQCKALEHGVF